MLTPDDKELINLTIEHFLTEALPKAMAQHVMNCPVNAKLKIFKWSIISFAFGIGFAAGNFGLDELIKLII